MTNTAKFTWNEKTTAFFADAYVAALGDSTIEEKAHANSEAFITELMEKFASENEGLKPVSVRSVRQKLASEKVYVKLEANEKPKQERVSKGKKINKVAQLVELIAKQKELDESELFEVLGSLENVTVSCLDQLLSILGTGKILVEDDGSNGE